MMLCLFVNTLKLEQKNYFFPSNVLLSPPQLVAFSPTLVIHTTSFNEFVTKGSYSALGIGRATALFFARAKATVLGFVHTHSHTHTQTHTGTQVRTEIQGVQACRHT